MVETDYSLTNLWPEFSRIAVSDFTSPEGLSAYFVAALFGLALLFSVLSIFNYFLANSHLRFYKKLLKDLTVEQLLDRRRELVNAALANKDYGRLWREFDESLVHIPQKQRLCNTLDAAHFFNTHTIARGLTENRLLAAVPGFLTAIGVIGTFAGLQLGLGPLGDLDPTNAKVDDLTHGIFGMIGGASIAFMTSVWGVLTSVLFNFFEKLLERSIRGSISAFQNEVDYLYPRITAEQSLSNIEDFTRQSNDRLAELDEKIGHKMQEAMREASGIISESVAQSLNTILGPAIERLVDNAHSGSEKALESLLDRFLQGVGSAGDSQKAMMEQAAKEITVASGGMTDGLNQFSSRLEEQLNSMVTKNANVLTQVNDMVKQQFESQSQHEKQRQEQFAINMGEFSANLRGQLSGLAEQNAEMLKAVQSELSGQIEEQQGREIARQKILHDQIKGFQATQERVTESIESVLSDQKEQSVELLSGLRTVVDRFEQLSISHQNATSAMQAASTELKAGSNQLGILSANLKSAIDSFGQQLTAALDKADSVTQVNSELSTRFKELVGDLRGAGEEVTRASNTFNEAASKAESGLTSVDRHFNSLAESLREHLAEVQQQVSKLLSDYAETVQSQTVARLNTWNEQTNSYISSMTDAVRTLSSVVDEIDGKVSTSGAGGNV
ncbi:anti-phage ZorAB system protein ZorA [Ketobacter sp. GenoA1]|uniref:anti-phage ZorAB system protein ZorA n=1 Tax=Ketobacter sp. GenoA1 TaxID=2072747 RepID=UPI000F2A5B23|nr:anti-phage ZorAB system protein ZorA [Ketobacter sp. GenoA1]RLT90792.1 MAG: chemotaxis protein [Ketobacter sp. GenoA1]